MDAGAVKRAIRAHRNKAHPLAMLLVGISFIFIGTARYPAFIAIGVFYIIIALRGFRMLRGS